MGLRINPQLDIPQRPLNRAASQLNETLTTLATGQRINRAADDAAGLAIAEGFRAEVRQFNQEVENLQQGANFLQTAEGGLATQQQAVGRLEELALQAANGTLNDEQRAALNQEAQQLRQEIDNTAQNTEFNGRRPLTGGDDGNVDVGGETQVPLNVDESTTDTLGLTGFDISTQAGAAAAIESAQAARTQIDQNRASIGAQENRLARAVEVREEASVNAAASESAIRDQDVAQAFIERTRNQILLQSSAFAQTQGSIVPETALRLLGG